MNVNVVIDVEMCHVPKICRWSGYPYSNEIIQLGAVKLNEAYDVVDKFSMFVSPIYGKIDNFITKLTEIHQRDVVKAPPLINVLEQLMQWIGDDVPTFFSWSDTDYYQIRDEIRAKKMDFENMEQILKKENWVDYQQIVSRRFGFDHQIKLSDALDLTEIDVEGRFHDGLADAFNTAMIIAKLEKNPGIKFALDKMRENKAMSVPFGTSLEGLLEGIELVSA